jgi:hypothetical protein
MLPGPGSHILPPLAALGIRRPFRVFPIAGTRRESEHNGHGKEGGALRDTLAGSTRRPADGASRPIRTLPPGAGSWATPLGRPGGP